MAASLVNPYGYKLLAHVFGFFGSTGIQRQTNEFLSPDFHTVNGKMFLVALLGVIAALAGSRRRPPVPVLLVVLVTVAFALLSQRNIELFALTALPLLALHLDSEWRALPVLRRAKAVFEQEHAGRYAGVRGGDGDGIARHPGARGRPGRGRDRREQPVRRAARFRCAP